MNILILYGSIEGQTQKIAEHIASYLLRHGHQVISLSCKQLPAGFSLENFDAVIIGGPIHMGKYPGYLQRFVKRHRDWLNSVPSALFTVCMGIRSEEAKSRETAAHYPQRFIEQTGWKPSVTRTFAGAVKYTQYNFITRFIMKMIARKEGGSTDTSRDHEYTNWEEVEDFAEAFMTKFAD